MWQNFKDFLNAPFGDEGTFAGLSAKRMFLVVGLVIVIVMLWRIILAHILYGIDQLGD